MNDYMLFGYNLFTFDGIPSFPDSVLASNWTIRLRYEGIRRSQVISYNQAREEHFEALVWMCNSEGFSGAFGCHRWAADREYCPLPLDVLNMATLDNEEDIYDDTSEEGDM